MVGKRRFAALLISTGFAIAAAGCASRGNPSIKPTEFSAQPALATTASTGTSGVVPSAYRIGPLDELRITVFREADLSAENLPVDLNGYISLPLLGQTKATGSTSEELAAAIKDRLNTRYLRDAQVSVSVTKPVNYSVTVDGEVKKPGLYQIPGSLTLLQAISLSEGLTEFAQPSEVVVFRMVGTERYVARFDLRDIRTARAPDPKMQQSDVIVVGYSRGARFGRDIVTALPALAGVFVALVR